MSFVRWLGDLCDGGKIFHVLVGLMVRGPGWELTAMPVRQWRYDKARLSGRWPLQHIISTAVGRHFSIRGPGFAALADDRKVAVFSRLMTRHIRLLPSSLTKRSCGRRIARWPRRHRLPARWVGGRVFPGSAMQWTAEQGLVLVVDAAHSIHPLAGQGINLGLSDVRVLSEQLITGQTCGLAVTSPHRLSDTSGSARPRTWPMAAMEGFKRGFGSRQPRGDGAQHGFELGRSAIVAAAGL